MSPRFPNPLTAEEKNMSFIKLTDLDLAGKRVLIRADLNVPVKDGKVTSDARITASMPTIEHCLKAGAKVMVMSHLGRPDRGRVHGGRLAQAVAEDMSRQARQEVRLIRDYLDGGFDVADGELVLLENVPLQQGREEGQRRPPEEIRRAVRRLRDGRLRHRAPRPGSTHGVAKFAPSPAPASC
jgi:phosphoglycerate kinase